MSPLPATIARHKGPLNYYADRFLIVAAAATTIQSIAIGWRDQFPDFRIFYVSAWLMRQGGDPYLGLAGQGIGGGLLCAAVMLFDFRPEIVRSWVISLSQINWQGHLTNVSVRGLAARWFAAPPQQPYVLTTTPIVASRELEVAAWIGAVLVVALLTARGATRRSDRTQAWAVIGLAALLLSPLAEVHYAIVGIGPIALAFARSRRWAAAWLTGIGLSLPYALVDRFHDGVIGTVTFGSVYGLSMIALWREMLRPLPGEAVSLPAGRNAATPSDIEQAFKTVSPGSGRQV